MIPTPTSRDAAWILFVTGLALSVVLPFIVSNVLNLFHHHRRVGIVPYAIPLRTHFSGPAALALFVLSGLAPTAVLSVELFRTAATDTNNHSGLPPVSSPRALSLSGGEALGRAATRGGGGQLLQQRTRTGSKGEGQPTNSEANDCDGSHNTDTNDPPTSAVMAVIQGGLLLLAGAVAAVYATLDLGVHPLQPAQVYASLVPVVVVGVAGGGAAMWAVRQSKSNTNMAPEDITRLGCWLRASVALYPAANTAMAVSRLLPGAAAWHRRLNSPDSGAGGGATNATVFLFDEHRHLADHPASYLVAHLMLLFILAIVLLMVKAGSGACGSLVLFSAVQFWIVSDVHTDVSDKTVAAVLVAHLLLLVHCLILVVVPRLGAAALTRLAWLCRKRRTAGGGEAPVHAAEAKEL